MSSWRTLLLPLTPLYQLALNARERQLASGKEPIRHLQYPVVSIGNLSTGGAGKTPMTIALAKALTARGFAVDVLSRGYGRNSKEPARVNPEGTAEEFGDEPLLIAREAGVPVYVAPQRYDAGQLAERASAYVSTQPSNPMQHHVSGHDFSRAINETQKDRALAPAASTPVHILDDGFQHRQLHRDIDILLLNRADWQDRLLPAGNLREPLHAAKRAHVIAIPASDAALESELRAWGWTGPVWQLKRHMHVPAVSGPVVAFCGIARPEQFFSGLEAAGATIAERVTFRDHHRYTTADLRKLENVAKHTGAVALLTTQKDHVRLNTIKTSVPVLAAGLQIEIVNESAAIDWLITQIQQRND